MSSWSGSLRAVRQPIMSYKGFAPSEAPYHDLGARIQLGERVFYYACNSTAAALAAGKLCQSPAPVALHKNISVAENTAVGAERIKVTLGASAATANMYAGGWLHFNDETPEGVAYKIKGHAAIDSEGTGYIDLYDPLQAAATTSSQVTLTKNRFKDVIVCPTTLTAPSAGVPLIAIPQSTSSLIYFFWLQTWGPCAVLTHGTLHTGLTVSASGTVAGAVDEISAVTLAAIGICRVVNADTEYSLIDLRIHP